MAKAGIFGRGAFGFRPGPIFTGAFIGSSGAAHQAVALTLAGFEPRVFAGSWSQWSNHPELLVATGPEPR